MRKITLVVVFLLMLSGCAKEQNTVQKSEVVAPTQEAQEIASAQLALSSQAAEVVKQEGAVVEEKIQGAVSEGISALKEAAPEAVQKSDVVAPTQEAQQILDEAKNLGDPAQQENFIIAKAKEYLAAGNYQTALDLANYVKTTLNSKSIDIDKIIADAQAALTKMMQQKAAVVP